VRIENAFGGEYTAHGVVVDVWVEVTGLQTQPRTRCGLGMERVRGISTAIHSRTSHVTQTRGAVALVRHGRRAS
jgi:hypothetical protein